MDSSTSPHGSEEFTKTLGMRSYEFIELICVILLSVFAVMSISEIASRESFSNSVETKLINLNENLANVALSISLPMDSGPTISEENWQSRKETIEYIKIFDHIKDRTTTLINTGVDSQQDTLKALTLEFQNAVNNLYEATAVDVASLESMPTSESYATVTIGTIYSMRSDHLLALAIVTSSALGALIFGLRNGLNMNIRTMTSGLATGFVVYLALKGGQHLFLITSPDVRIPANPFSSAFAGLLAGLFSDKAYRMLALIVDNLTAKVEASSSNNGSNTSSNESPQDNKENKA